MKNKFKAWLYLAGLVYCSAASAQMVAPQNWVNYEQVLGVKNNQRNYDFDVYSIASSSNTNVLWPGEQLNSTIQVINNLGVPFKVNGKIELIRYGTKGRPNDVWLPEMHKLAEVSSTPVSVNIAAHGYADIQIQPVIPATFGGYALILDLGEHGRRLINGVVRTFAADTHKLQFPKQSLDDMGPDFLHRLGVQTIRMGVEYTPTTDKDYPAKMAALEAKLKRYHDQNITVLLVFSNGTAPMPFSMPRPLLDSSNTMRKTKADYVWMPAYDADFTKFVHRLCTSQGWPAGPVTAVSLWNEPWEGSSISGWQSDIPRYREIYRAMAEGVLEARKTGAQVLVGGGDSSTNAWDKLFADGQMDFLPIFDFCSIHYQGMESPAIYPEWINRQSPNGRVKIWDTESWVGNTDDRIGLTVATNRSTGYDRSMGIYAGYLSTGGRGAEHYQQKIQTASGVKNIDRIPDAWSPAVAVAAVQHLVGDRDFNRLLFSNGLPWIMLFNGYDQQVDDGSVVICGDIGEAFGPEHVLFRNVRGLVELKEKEAIRAQLKDTKLSAHQKDSLNALLKVWQPLNGGHLTLPNDPAFRLYDFYGNIIPAEGKEISVPLNAQGYFMRTDGSKGSYNRLIAALQKAHIVGYEPVEIIARDMTARIENKPELSLQLTNVLNRPVSGRLKVALGNLQVSAPEEVHLLPHQTLTVPVKVSGGQAVPNNTYPLAVYFDAGADGQALHQEDMHVNTIMRKTIKVDGKLDDWQQALPQNVSSKGTEGVSLTEAAWYPFKNFETSGGGYANGYMAYDDRYFYFAAKVADNTPNKGAYRFEHRPDDSFFYPDTAYAIDAVKTLITKETMVKVAPGDVWALQTPGEESRNGHYWESGDNTNSFGVDIDLPTDRLTRVAFYLPNIKSGSVQLEIYDGASGKLLLLHKTDNLWNGVYQVYNLRGKIRAVLHSAGWWYTAKLAGIFFDQVNDNGKPAFLKEDLDSKGNWKGVYGRLGFMVMGSPAYLPEDIQVKKVTLEQKKPFIWPQGVRHYTYAHNPVTPDNSGLGYSFDNVLLAFNVLPAGEDGLLDHPPGTMPRYTGYKCTDYEYALNPVAAAYGGGTEIWRLLTPQLNRKHFFPRQPKSPGEGPVKDGQLVITRDGNTLITECAIPWSELPDVKKALDAGKKIKISFRLNDDGAPGSCMELAKDRSVSKINSRAFHPDWKTHWANEVEFAFEK